MYSRTSEQVFHNLKHELDVKQIDHDFSHRLGAVFHDLYTIYTKLYHNHPNTDIWFKKLLLTLCDNYKKRPAYLKNKDLQRVSASKWYLSNKLVSTMVYVDRFSGNLNNFIDKIPYLEELGVNLIHLMPIMHCPKDENDGGYAVKDFRTVDPLYGTNKDLVNVIKEIQKRDMFLQLDFVINHTSDQHEWALKAKSGLKEYQDYYYFFPNRFIPDKYEAAMPEVFPETAPGNFTYCPETNSWVMTVFHHYQWDLNYTNPEVFVRMLDTYFFLANLGVDFIRLDAVPFLWKRIGSNGQNEEEAHWILQLLHQCVQTVCPGVVSVSEAVVAPKEICRYLGEGNFAGKECEAGYHASLMVSLWDSIAAKNSRLLRIGLKNLPSLPQETTWLTYIRCHDDIGLGYADDDIREAGYDPFLHRLFIRDYYTGRFPGSPAAGDLFMFNPLNQDARISGTTASLLGLEKALAENSTQNIDASIKRILMLYAVILSFGGVPIIYYGDELGTINDYSYLQELKRKHDNRWMHRPIMNWEKAKKRKQKGTIEQRVFSGLQRLIALRKSIAEFDHTTEPLVVPCEHEAVFSFIREKEGAATLVLINSSDRSIALPCSYFEHLGFSLPLHDWYTEKRYPPNITGKAAVNAAVDKQQVEKNVYTPQMPDFILTPYTFAWLH